MWSFSKYKEFIIGGLIAVLFIGFVIASQSRDVVINPPDFPPRLTPTMPAPTRQPEVKMPKFTSCGQLQEKLSPFAQNGSGDIVLKNSDLAFQLPGTSSSTGKESSSDFSRTNVQVEGVDEADIVKTDGSYIYILSNSQIHIIKAGDTPTKVSSIPFQNTNEYPQQLFIDNTSLIVIGTKSRSYANPLNVIGKMIFPGPSYGGQITFVKIFNTAQKENPSLQRTLEFDSSYLTSRLIQDDMYLVMSKYAGYSKDSIESTLPSYADGVQAADSLRPLVKCTDVSYADPVLDAQYLTIVSIPTNPYDKKIGKEVVLGAGQTFYASQYNLYTATTKYRNQNNGYYLYDMPYQQGTEYTKLHKFNLIDGSITHVAAGEVEGRLLNQFSMDEYEGYLRLATTIGHVSQQGSATDNRVYVLDHKLTQAGSVTGIAPGEQIYSARFMGRRGYLVTFKKVDPFFTLDLSDPRSPRVAGQLKIPGFSDYLHPYDENHIIGVGKETIEAEGGNFAWYQGLKMAIFDVSDFNNPKELHRIIIGDRGSDSPVLTDHKAFLFSKEKNLLVIPATIALIDEEQKRNPPSQFPAYGKTSFQGALVYSIDLNNGFQERTRIAHDATPGQPQLTINRSLYIGDLLYTLSNTKLQNHRLSDFTYVGEVNLVQ